VKLPIVQEEINPRDPMPEGQALRRLLVEAAQQAMGHMNQIPGLSQAKFFLESYLKGKKMAEIAQELGVSREWCSRAYRKEAFDLAMKQFLRLASRENQKDNA
jgi:DNA-directed RNA polymerase specialized sigma24 family protein